MSGRKRNRSPEARVRRRDKRREAGHRLPNEYEWYTLTFWKIRHGRLKTRIHNFMAKLRSPKCRRYHVVQLRRKLGLHASYRYQRRGIVPVDEVLPLINVEREAVFCGVTISLTSKRYKCFKKRGVRCVKCGIEGMFFAVERHRNQHTAPWHLNLYHVCADGNEKMMTVDHIIPRSKGGSESVKNLQPMCQHCNSQKSNVIIPEKKRKYPGKWKETRPPEECSIKKELTATTDLV